MAFNNLQIPAPKKIKLKKTKDSNRPHSEFVALFIPRHACGATRQRTNHESPISSPFGQIITALIAPFEIRVLRLLIVLYPCLSESRDHHRTGRVESRNSVSRQIATHHKTPRTPRFSGR